MAGRSHPKTRLLMVVEGDKTEPRLMRRCFDLLNLKDVDCEIVPFSTNIYQFIRYVDENYDGDFENIDIPAVLRELYPERSALLDGGFADIVLVFDYDPQDSAFDQSRLEKVMSIFNESTDLGKLYLNYPAVEALRDFSCYGERSFYDSSVRKDELMKGGYKRVVRERVPPPRFTDFKRMSSPDLANIIAMNVGKIQHLVVPMPIEDTVSWARRPSLTEEYLQLNLEDLLHLQGEKLSQGSVFICGTCLFFFLEHWGAEAIDPLWRKASA